MEPELRRATPWALPVPRRTVGLLPATWLADRVRPPATVVAVELVGRQFRFADDTSDSQAIFLKASGFLATTPTLQTAVAGAVDEIVLLAAKPGYDVSHSEPRWPRTVFVTATPGPGQDSALRALENIVHEAMHLQLTTYETGTPLVADTASRMVSPWRAEPRQLQGVLHGAYVFRCIAAFFCESRFMSRLDEAGTAYVTRRLTEISGELATIEFDRLHRGLTSAGKAFCDALLRNLPDAENPMALCNK